MIGKPVTFGPPGDVRRNGGRGIRGIVKDEVWVTDRTAPGTWGEYAFFAQWIHWDSGRRSIRLGYYRRRVGERHWEFGSQTTISSNAETIKDLLKATLAKRDWFRS
jgi:hypothetical protein